MVSKGMFQGVGQIVGQASGTEMSTWLVDCAIVRLIGDKWRIAHGFRNAARDLPSGGLWVDRPNLVS
jgi:hypothetical protein